MALRILANLYSLGTFMLAEFPVRKNRKKICRVIENFNSHFLGRLVPRRRNLVRAFDVVVVVVVMVAVSFYCQ